MLVIVESVEGRPRAVHPVAGPLTIGGVRVAPEGGGVRVNGARDLAPGDAFTSGAVTLTLLELPLSGPTAELEAMFFLSSNFEHLSSLDRLLGAMLERLEQQFRAERGAILLERADGKGLEVAVLASRQEGGRAFRFSRTIAEQVFRSGKAVLLSDTEDAAGLDAARSIHDQSVRSVLCAPLADGARTFGVVYLDSRMASRVFDPADRDLLARFAAHVSRVIGPARESDRLRKDVAVLRRLNREQNRQEHDPDGMVVGSAAMRWVMEQVEMLAASDTTALILGESGTGKELVAKAIHDRSPRRDALLVPLNVMALSATVVESELFGHEKGAFTGATERRLGRFEMAQGGTLFLDECAELSLEMQVKLLRVLEARVVERVGGSGPVPVDVRLVCATNKDLPALIAAGQFREDLYYRLNVFSLVIPPLRERREEIPQLVDFFLRMFRARGGKAIEGITGEALGYLQQYDWPGNVRELKNVIERAFVLEREREITPKSLPFNMVGEPRRAPAPPAERLAAKLSAQEEVLIKSALAKYEGNISQAARELGITRKTLYKRMREYGIGGAEE